MTNDLPKIDCRSYDPERFLRACAQVQSTHDREGIGTLGEKNIHAVLKYYFDGDPDNHELAVGDSVADIIGEQGVIEIQTRQFRRLNKKLTHLLPVCPVTVVYPVVVRKRILWIDPESGELLRSGAMRVFQKPACVFPELYQIREHITHPNFSLCLALMEAEDFRFADGYGAGNRSRATKIDRIPTKLLDIQHYACAWDYRTFVPNSLPEEFTSADLAKQLHIPKATAQAALRVLNTMELIRLCGKTGRFHLYCRNTDTGFFTKGE